MEIKVYIGVAGQFGGALYIYTLALAKKRHILTP